MSGPSVFPSSSNMRVNGGTWNAVGGNQYNYNVHTAAISQVSIAYRIICSQPHSRHDQNNFTRTLSTQSSPPLSSPEVYARQLLLTRNGYPLWVPEPLSNCSVYRSKGVRIGDVGYVDRDSGAFAPMFNIRAQPDDLINRLGVPEGFETVEFDPNDIVPIPEYHRPNCAVTSKPQIVDGLKLSRYAQFSVSKKSLSFGYKGMPHPRQTLVSLNIRGLPQMGLFCISRVALLA